MAVGAIEKELAQDVYAVQRTNLLTLPIELRGLVYEALFQRPVILINRDTINLEQWPWQLAAVCRQLREESYQFLRDPRSIYELELQVVHGYFPQSVDRQLPRYIFNRVKRILVTQALLADEIKPTLSRFPNLSCLAFDLASKSFLDGCAMVHHGMRLQRGECGSLHPTADVPGDYLMRHFVRWLLAQIRPFHWNSENAREGLEHDYLVDDSLFKICSRTRAQRGFRICARVTWWTRSGPKLADQKRKAAMVDLEEYLDEDAFLF